MSQKKRKQNKNNNYRHTSWDQTTKLGSEQQGETKRFNPTARNILFGDLVMLCLVQFLSTKGWMSELYAGILTLIGTGLMFLAVWYQFGNPKGRK